MASAGIRKIQDLGVSLLFVNWNTNSSITCSTGIKAPLSSFLKSYHTTSHHATPHCIMPCHIIPHHTTLYHVIPHYTTSYHTIPTHTTLDHIILHHSTPHHNILNTTILHTIYYISPITPPCILCHIKHQTICYTPFTSFCI